MLAPIRKYNFWDENPIDLGYLRTFYTDKIGQYIDNKLIKVLVGQRRAGKSYILRQIASQLISSGTSPYNILYINKEYLEFSDIHNYQDLERLFQQYRKELNPQGKYSSSSMRYRALKSGNDLSTHTPKTLLSLVRYLSVAPTLVCYLVNLQRYYREGM